MVRLSDVMVDEGFVPIGSGYRCPMKVRKRVQKEPGGPSLTKQSLAEETDVNAIMRKYLSAGVVPEMRPEGAGRFGDFASGLDFQQAMNAVSEARSIFSELPLEVRIFCEHDPAKLIDMVYSEDPAMRKRAEEFGLVPRPKESPPVPSEPTKPEA